MYTNLQGMKRLIPLLLLLRRPWPIVCSLLFLRLQHWIHLTAKTLRRCFRLILLYTYTNLYKLLKFYSWESLFSPSQQNIKGRFVDVYQLVYHRCTYLLQTTYNIIPYTEDSMIHTYVYILHIQTEYRI